MQSPETSTTDNKENNPETGSENPWQKMAEEAPSFNGGEKTEYRNLDEIDISTEEGKFEWLTDLVQNTQTRLESDQENIIWDKGLSFYEKKEQEEELEHDEVYQRNKEDLDLVRLQNKILENLDIDDNRSVLNALWERVEFYGKLMTNSKASEKAQETAWRNQDAAWKLWRILRDEMDKRPDGERHEELKNVEIRELGPNDDFGRAAELVYQVDPYICPDFFGDEERARKMGPILFDEEGGLFDKKHTLVAESDGELKGILVYANNKMTPWDAEGFKKKVEALGIEIPENFDRANEEYMSPVSEDARNLPDGVVEIEFFAVDESARGLGVGQKLMDQILENPNYNEWHLTVLADNPGAIHVYEKKGFKIVSEQQGYPNDEVRTYNMVRKS